MEPAICIEMLWPGLRPEEKLAAVAAHGFRCAEFWSHADKDVHAIAQASLATGVRIVNFSGQRKGDLVDDSTHDLVLRDIAASVPVAYLLGSRDLLDLTIELGEGGRVLHPCPHIPGERKRANVVAGLDRVMRSVPDDLGIVLEPLNTVLDHPGYYLSDIAAAAGIVREVGHPRLRLLCDFYHLALMGADPVAVAGDYADLTGHVHIADYPGRHEPGSGTGPWAAVLARLHESGYRGRVGFEFSPGADPDAALESIARLWKDVFGSAGATV